MIDIQSLKDMVDQSSLPPILPKAWTPKHEYVEISRGIGIDYQERVVPKHDVKSWIHAVENGDKSVVFTTSEGDKYELTHHQDCCEYVYIESVVGDLQDLVGNPITMAERVTQTDDSGNNESATWTFLKFATIKGYVDIRFHGSSNGYYSETASMYKLT